LITLIDLGDGDSSVTKRLNEILPYGSQFKIKKIECRNHLLRNYCTKLMSLTKRTDYPITVRKCITSNIMRFRFDITKAMVHHLNKNSSIQQKVIGWKLFIYFSIRIAVNKLNMYFL